MVRKSRRPGESTEENAYRIVYISEGKEFVSFQMDTNLIRRLLPIESGIFQLLSVETVSLRTLEDFSTVEILWEKGDLFQE